MSTRYTGITNEILPCIVCGVEFESPVGSNNESNMPYQGTVFYSHGNYGSTVWDPMFLKTLLYINVCDECLKEAAKKDRVHVTKTTEDTTYHTEHWNPSRNLDE